MMSDLKRLTSYTAPLWARTLTHLSIAATLPLLLAFSSSAHAATITVNAKGDLGVEIIEVSIGATFETRGSALQTQQLSTSSIDLPSFEANATVTDFIFINFPDDNGDVHITSVKVGGTTFANSDSLENTASWQSGHTNGCNKGSNSGPMYCPGHMKFGPIPAAEADPVVAVPVEPEAPVTAPSIVVETGVSLSLPNNPVEQGKQPPANILIMADDSLSMDWEMVVAQDAEDKEESLEINTNTTNSSNYSKAKARYNYLYGHTTRTKFQNARNVTVKQHGRVAPPYFRVNTLSTSAFAPNTISELKGIWRLRNHQYNLMYYNPATRYEPWPGGTYGASSPSNASTYPGSGSFVDLTANIELTVHIPKGHSNASEADLAHRENVWDYIPKYYTLTSGALDNQNINKDECSTLVQIKSDARSKNCEGGVIDADTPLYPMDKAPTRTDCASSTQCSYSEEIQNFANWFTYYRRREFVAKAALANAVVSATDVRIGYATVNAEGSGTRPSGPNGAYYSDLPLKTISATHAASDVANLLSAIYKTRGVGGTELINALDRSGQYFQGGANGPFVNTSIVSTTKTKPDPSYAACQMNSTILMTDGFWRENKSDWDNGSINRRNNSAMDDNDTTAANNLTSPFTGGAFADSSGSSWQTVADVAMHYFKTDLNTDPTVANRVVPTTTELSRLVSPMYWDTHTFMHQHMNTYTVGFGVFNTTGTPIGSVDDSGKWTLNQLIDSVVTWPTFPEGQIPPTKLEDLKHTALNGRGHYYNANDASSLTDNLSKIFAAAKSGGTSLGAVSFNSSKLTTGSVAYSASYESRYNSGDVLAYNIDSAGIVNTATPKWSASTRLATKINNSCSAPSDNRIILSYARDGANSAGVVVSGATPHLSADQVGWLRGHNQNEGSFGELPQVCNGLGYRGRPQGRGVLGDIVHSKPLYVGIPTRSKKGGDYPTGTKAYQVFKDTVIGATPADARSALVMVGANDSLFHIFDAENGDEKMAYLPQRLQQGLNGTSKTSDLIEDDYSHKFFVDLPPSVEDIFIKPNSAERAWHTIAIGGYRAGGKGYFALDVTDLDTSINGSSVLWEFSDLDDERLGNTYSPPLMTMSNVAHTSAGHGNKWQAIFGNGYNSKDGKARLFMLDIEQGANGWASSDYTVLETGTAQGASETKNGLSTPRGVDVDQNGTVDYLYAGDLKGNVYRFDVTSSSPTVTKIFEAKDSDGLAQPITTRPYVIPHPNEASAHIVVITTGSWITEADTENRDIQSIYGFVDRPLGSAHAAYVRNDMLVRNLKNVAETTNGQTVTYRVITGASIDWTTTATKGWYFDFDVRASPLIPGTQDHTDADPVHAGERAIRNMVFQNGYIFVNTVFPANFTRCSSTLGGALMAFSAATGKLSEPTLDANGDGVLDTIGNENVAGNVYEGDLSDITASEGEVHFTNSGQLESKKIQPLTSNRTGRLSWVQLE